jgi:hypothetical protein
VIGMAKERKDNQEPEALMLKGKKVVEITKMIEELNDMLMDFRDKYNLGALELITLLKQITDLIQMAYIESLIDEHIAKYISSNVRVGG